MQENLIKNYVQLESGSKGELITVNVVLEIKIGVDKTVLESIKMNFNKNMNVNDMLKEIIVNFNDSLETNHKKIYLNPERPSKEEIEEEEEEPETIGKTKIQKTILGGRVLTVGVWL